MKRMLLPNCKEAYVPAEKLNDYLPSETHAVGKAKAKWFRSLGYTEANAGQMADALLMVAKSEGVSKEVTTFYGTKYIVEVYWLKGALLRPAELPYGGAATLERELSKDKDLANLLDRLVSNVNGLLPKEKFL